MNYKLKLHRDDDPPDPRENDNLGRMVCFHPRYNLGDEQPRVSPDEWLRDLACELDETLADRLDYWENGNGWQALANKADAMGNRHAWRLADEKIEAAVQKVLDARAVMLPLYLYDHSGLSMSTGGFSCPWDSGQVGYIYASREDVLKEYGGKKLTAATRQRAVSLLKAEVEEYDHFLRGDAWGWAVYEVDDECDCEPDEECSCTRHAYCEDSCWGYLGSEAALEDGKASLEWLEKDKESE